MITSPLSQASIACHHEGPHGPTVPPGRKVSPRWQPRSYLPRVMRGNLWGSTTGDQIEVVKGGGASRNQCSDLNRLSSSLYQHQSKDLSQWLCLSAELSWWPHLARELSWQFCLIWVPGQQSMLAVKPILWTHMAGKQVGSST